MTNPLRMLRGGLRCSRRDLALLLGVSYASVTHAENGYPDTLPPSIFDALKRKGFNADAIAAAYLTWREAEEAEVARAVAKTPIRSHHDG